MEYTRNAKIWQIEHTQEFEQVLSIYRRLLNDISNHVFKEIQEGKLISIHSTGVEQYVLMDYCQDDKGLSRAKYRDTVQFILDKYPILPKRKNLERDVVGYVLQRYSGYYKRNGAHTKSKIVFDGELKYKDRSVSVDTKKKTISFPTLFGDFTLNYGGGIKLDLIEDKKQAGNFIPKEKSSEFVMAIKVPFEPQYKPTSVLGFDLNKSLDSWLVFNTGDVIRGDESVEQYIKEIRELNKIIDNRSKGSLRAKQRRHFRLRVRNKHRKFDRRISEVCEKIIEVAKDKEALLCLDMVKTGQKMGTFGQDKILPQLQTMCENQGIPFIAVPCKNTSRRCSSCGYVHKDNRKTVDEFKCLKCEYEDLSHLNAAKNIAFLGNKMFEAGVPYGNHGKISVEKLIERHGSHQHPKQHVMTFMAAS